MRPPGPGLSFVQALVRDVHDLLQNIPNFLFTVGVGWHHGARVGGLHPVALCRRHVTRHAHGMLRLVSLLIVHVLKMSLQLVRAARAEGAVLAQSQRDCCSSPACCTRTHQSANWLVWQRALSPGWIATKFSQTQWIAMSRETAWPGAQQIWRMGALRAPSQSDCSSLIGWPITERRSNCYSLGLWPEIDRVYVHFWKGSNMILFLSGPISRVYQRRWHVCIRIYDLMDALYCFMTSIRWNCSTT